MKYNYLILLFCILLAACATSNYAINIPSEFTSKSYTIWYSDDDINLPLLGGLEHTTKASQEAKLGLVFLQGKRFAECNYANDALTCNLSSGLQSTKMQTLAENIAQIIAHTLQSTNPLPLYWEKISVKEGKLTFYHTKNKSQLLLEETS